jgi:hypothetical protein
MLWREIRPLIIHVSWKSRHHANILGAIPRVRWVVFRECRDLFPFKAQFAVNWLAAKSLVESLYGSSVAGE